MSPYYEDPLFRISIARLDYAEKRFFFAVGLLQIGAGETLSKLTKWPWKTSDLRDLRDSGLRGGKLHRAISTQHGPIKTWDLMG